MGLFSGADNSQMMGTKLPRLGDFSGRHVLKVDTIKAKVGEGKFAGQPLFVVEGEIVKSSNPTCPPGTKLGWVVVRDHKWPDYFYSDVKRFVAAIAPKVCPRPEDVKEAHMDAISADPRVKGRFVAAYCFPKISKGKTIGQVEWSPADAATDVGPMLPASAVSQPAPAAGAPATPAASNGGFAPPAQSAPAVDFGF